MNFFDLILIVKVNVKMLNSIVVSCDESFVTRDTWTYTASQVHTRVILFI